MPFYQQLGEIPRKHHIWFHRNGAGPGHKNEGIYYEHVVTTDLWGHERKGPVHDVTHALIVQRVPPQQRSADVAIRD